MSSSPRSARRSSLGLLAALPILMLLALPVVALVLSGSPADLQKGFRHPQFAPALWLSARTSVLSLAIVVLAGTPLAWWLAGHDGPRARAVELLVDLPIVLPPAVVGLGLLRAFGRTGLLGETLGQLGVHLPFTTAAVVLAQVTVATPFYVQSAAAAFRSVDTDLLLVARTLGQRPLGAFLRVAAPLALPGLVAGAALAWARALGEFGATLLFAGNAPGTTQTMPLAIYMTLESDVRGAVALALVLAAVSVVLLLVLRVVPVVTARRSRAREGSS